MSDARKRAEEALAKWDSPVARQLHEKHSDAVDCVLALRALLADAPPADAATEDNGYAPTIADARMHIERLTRSLSQPHSADERFFAINEARTWLAKTAAAKADAATEAVNRLSPIATEPVARAAEIVRERLRIYGNTSTYLYDCPGLVAEVTDLLDALALSTRAPAPSAKPCVNCDGHQTCERCGGSGGGPDLPHRCISCDGTGRCYLCVPPSAPAIRRGEGKGDDRG